MNNLPGLLGFAPGTLAIWAAMLFGVTCALADAAPELGAERNGARRHEQPVSLAIRTCWGALSLPARSMATTERVKSNDSWLSVGSGHANPIKPSAPPT